MTASREMRNMILILAAVSVASIALLWWVHSWA
jgi:hypothetical protein